MTDDLATELRSRLRVMPAAHRFVAELRVDDLLAVLAASEARAAAAETAAAAVAAQADERDREAAAARREARDQRRRAEKAEARAAAAEQKAADFHSALERVSPAIRAHVGRAYRATAADEPGHADR